MTTALFTHPYFTQHLTPEHHPENPQRLKAIEQALSNSLFDNLKRIDANKIDIEQISSIHTQGFIDKLAGNLPQSGIAYIDQETIMSPKSLDASSHAAGAMTQAIDMMMNNEITNAFCAVRPPGHHSERDTAMGFCLINSIALGAYHALKKHQMRRVAIVDFDVHHGNGTQDIVSENPDILFCSSHQMPLYPGSGYIEETGVGNIVNLPLFPGSGSREFREAWLNRGLPAVKQFQPDIILVSAGFDAHRLDPLANINLDENDYVWITSQLMELASMHCNNRVVSILEGGYHLQALADSTAQHVYTLMTGQGLK